MPGSRWPSDICAGPWTARSSRCSLRSRAELDDEGRDLLGLLSVESTVVRAHQHAAGARPGCHTGGESNCSVSPEEPDDHAIGRSRGGLTTKIHALTDELYSPVTFALSPGQAGDNPMLWPLLQAHRTRSSEKFRLLADKAYSHDSTRVRLREMRISHTLPERSDQMARRKAKGSAADRRRSTRARTDTATPSSAASTGSSTGVEWPPATTSTR